MRNSKRVLLNEDPRYPDFVERYAGSLYRFAVEVIGVTPSAQQKTMMDLLSEPGSRVSVSSGHGCFAAGTSVMMADGSLKPVEHIRLGDDVMGWDGTPRNVNYLRHGREMMWRIVLKDGEEMVVNDSHVTPFVCTGSKGRWKTGDIEPMTARQFLSLSKTMQGRFGLQRCDAIELPKREQPIPPYVFGLWLAEGHQNGGRFTIAARDAHIISAIQAYADSVGTTLKIDPLRNGAHVVTVRRFRPKHGFPSILKTVGIQKDGERPIPDCYALSSIEDRRLLLAGIIDGDGHKDARGNVIEISQKRKELAESIVQVARSLGIRASIAPKKVKIREGDVRVYWRIFLTRNLETLPCYVFRKRSGEITKKAKTTGVRSIEPIGEGDYFGFTLGTQNDFVLGNGYCQFNSGKSATISMATLWHLLCYFQSWTLITANDYDQIKASSLKELAKMIGMIKRGPHGWVADHIELLAEGTLRIVGHEESWKVETKVANSKNANKMAGRHAQWLLIIADEASSIPDEVLTTLSGALTEVGNRFLLTSQPTRNAGFFYKTHHIWSKAQGGRWDTVVLTSIESPWTSEEALLDMWNRYDEDERRVRLLGQFPQDSSKMFMGIKEAQAAWAAPPSVAENWGWVIACDVASGEGQRDKSVVSIARVSGFDDDRRVEVVDIPLCTNNIRSNQIAHYIAEIGGDYPNVTYAVDSGGLGINVCQDLEDMGKNVLRINWGAPCFRRVNSDRYLNLRAQATHQMARAFREGRISIGTQSFKSIALDQLSNLPKRFTDRGKIKVPSKGTADWEGRGSPDLADSIAFLFLENLAPIAAGEASSDVQSLTSAADDLFADLQ